jgi:hypothetical protein
MKTLIIISAIISTMYSFFADDLKSSAVADAHRNQAVSVGYQQP